MKEKTIWKKPNEIAFYDTVATIKASDAVRMNLKLEDFEYLLFHSPYISPLMSASDSLFELAAASLGLYPVVKGGRKMYQSGSITNEDFIIIDKEDFVSMIYDCVNDHTMLHNIYEAFVNHDAEASDAVMKKYETLL